MLSPTLQERSFPPWQNGVVLPREVVIRAQWFAAGQDQGLGEAER